MQPTVLRSHSRASLPGQAVAAFQSLPVSRRKFVSWKMVGLKVKGKQFQTPLSKYKHEKPISQVRHLRLLHMSFSHYHDGKAGQHHIANQPTEARKRTAPRKAIVLIIPKHLSAISMKLNRYSL